MTKPTPAARAAIARLDALEGFEQARGDLSGVVQSTCSLPELERAVAAHVIRRALELDNGVKARAAERLGIKRTTLVERCKALAIPLDYATNEPDDTAESGALSEALASVIGEAVAQAVDRALSERLAKYPQVPASP